MTEAFQKQIEQEARQAVTELLAEAKLIKDVLKGLNDLFSVRTSSITVKGVRDGSKRLYK